MGEIYFRKSNCVAIFPMNPIIMEIMVKASIMGIDSPLLLRNDEKKKPIQR